MDDANMSTPFLTRSLIAIGVDLLILRILKIPIKIWPTVIIHTIQYRYLTYALMLSRFCIQPRTTKNILPRTGFTSPPSGSGGRGMNTAHYDIHLA